ncbi:propionyl-CoA carboxylase [Cyathus striatus]|nr:propionyl-CoA carboxylase [Cyathus striatus]
MAKDDNPTPTTKDEHQDDGTSWKVPLESLKALQTTIRTPNPSSPGYARQKAQGKLWVHERISLLLDKGSFMEVGSVTGKWEGETFIPANAVIGWGKVNSRRVFVTADDFSVRGGHADGGIQMKAPYGETMARKARVPLIRLLDGSSGGGSVALYLTLGATYIPTLAGLGQSMDAMAVVPVASALLGPVVGLAAAKAVCGHFSVMVKDLSQLFAAGPPIVSRALFETHTKSSLGGHLIHSTNGTIDNLASSESDAFTQIHTFLSYLPSSIFQLPPVRESTDDPGRKEEWLLDIIPRRRARGYDVRKIILGVVDREGEEEGEFFEIGRGWGRCIVTGFARAGGRPIGVLASDCMVNGGESAAGAIDALGAQKTARFVNMCDHFSVPILNLVDQPGFAIGSQAEKSATIRHGAAAMAALYHTTTPIFTIILRRVFGVAGGAFTDVDDGANLRISWPSGDWGSLPLEGGIEAAYKRKLNAAPSPEAREALMNDLLGKFEEVRSPMKTAHMFGIEEIVDPRVTRSLVCQWAEHVYDNILPQLVAVKTTRFGYDGVPSAGRGYKL